MKKLALRKGFLEIIVVILVLVVFSILIFKYYGTPDNPRFVKVDYKKLQEEANRIANSSIIVNETAKNVFILTYHVVSRKAPQDEYETPYEQFKNNMFTLKSLGYQTVSLDDLYLFMNREKELPDKSFVITFDDAAKTAYYNTDSILKVLNYTAVMFVITEHSLEEKQNAYYLNQTELLEAYQTGRWEIEAHTHALHYRLPISEDGEIGPALTNKLWLKEENRLESDEEFFNRLSNDFSKAKFLLETKFNKPVTSFALPYGDFGDDNNYDDAREIVYSLSTGMHKMVFYQFPMKDMFFKSNYRHEKNNSYVLVRFAADSFRTPSDLLERIDASRNIALPYYEDFSNYDRWPRISGEASFQNDTMILTPFNNFVFTYLDGSYLWEDYVYSITLQNNAVSEISLVSRLTESGDYISCRYGRDFIKITNLAGNVQTDIAEATFLRNIYPGTIISMSVLGSNVTCLIDGVAILNTSIENMSNHGGVGVRVIGFETEDKKFMFSNITIEINSQ